MENITAVMASWQAFLLAFAAFAVIGVIRGIGTKKSSLGKITGGWAQSRPFKMLLPVYPYIVTLGFIFVPGTPIPEKVGAALGARILFALWCGWLSDKAFEIVKRVLDKGFNVKLGANKLTR